MYAMSSSGWIAGYPDRTPKMHYVRSTAQNTVFRSASEFAIERKPRSRTGNRVHEFDLKGITSDVTQSNQP